MISTASNPLQSSFPTQLMILLTKFKKENLNYYFQCLLWAFIFFHSFLMIF